MTLSKQEIEFYNRQLLLKEFGVEGQLKLKNSKVLVIGAGGLGCPVLQYLTAAGVGCIGIIDYDRVEISNLHRQILYNTNDIGKFKSETAALKLSLLNPFIKMEAMNFRLTVENACDIFKNYDVIVDGSDNFPTRYMVNDACVLTGKVLVYGSVDKFAGQVSVFNQELSSGVRSGTYRCIFPSPPISGTVMNCAEAGVLGILPGIIGTIQATEAIKIITGIGNTLANRLLIADGRSMQFTEIAFSRNQSGWLDFPSSEKEFSQMNYQFLCESNQSVNSISIEQFEDYMLRKNDFLLLDVREMNEETIDESAIRIPLSELHLRAGELNTNLPIIVVCASGIRSAQAIKILQNGIRSVELFQLEGGWNCLKNHQKSTLA